jgi:hypothetical protein
MNSQDNIECKILIEGVFELDFKLIGTSNAATDFDSVERTRHLSNSLNLVVPISNLL